MRMNRLFSQTLRQAPADTETRSQQYLLRAGYLRPMAAGVFSYLPLAQRVIQKICQILREEINEIGGQEINMPVVLPASLWQESGRWVQVGSELGRFKDKNQRDMILAMTHEEAVADLVRREVHSYRQLPSLLYHIQTKWRDDPRPRAGLIRAREFTMKDSYSLDADWDGLDLQYSRHQQAYARIFQRCGLPVISVQSDVGMMGGLMAHEFMYVNPLGEDSLLLCDHCDYRANRQIAQFQKPSAAPEARLDMQAVPTPHAETIEALAAFLQVPKSRTAKAVFLVATLIVEQQPQESFVFAVVRGDMEVNETKLANLIKAVEMRPARPEEIAATGAVAGYASPVGLENVLIVIDEAIPSSPNLVAGANRAGYHLLNVNYGRDFAAQLVGDITAARQGDACPRCGSPLRLVRSIEVGNIFKLGTRYSEALGCKFLDRDGQEKYVIMGSYGIGVGRLLACIAEHWADDSGLVWPISVAPFAVHLVLLDSKQGEGAREAAEDLYTRLLAAGIEVLFDDRQESPGVKFKDADLIGIPIRVTIGERSLNAGGVEVKLRQSEDKTIVSLQDCPAHLLGIIQVLKTEQREAFAA